MKVRIAHKNQLIKFLVSSNKLDSSVISDISKASSQHFKEYRIRTKAKKGRSVLKHITREQGIQRALNKNKRPSTKEAIDRN